MDILLDDCWLLLGMMFFDLYRFGNGVFFFFLGIDFVKWIGIVRGKYVVVFLIMRV